MNEKLRNAVDVLKRPGMVSLERVPKPLPPELSAREDELRAKLAEIDRRYKSEAQPIVEELAEIENRREYTLFLKPSN